MIHLTLNQISAYLDAELPVASVELVRLHLSACLECTEQFAQLEEQEDVLARLIANDPGDAFFEGFPDRVLGARPPSKSASVTSAATARAAPAPTTDRPPPGRAIAERPRADRPAQASIPAPAPGASKASDARGRPARPARRRGRSRVLLPLGVLALLATSIAVMVFERNQPMMKLFRSPPPEPGGLAPASGEAAPTEAPAPEAGAADALERAAAASAAADRVRTSASYEAAAAAWEAAIAQLEDAEELAAGRHEIAAARYAAWAADPTPDRRASATAAVRSYLLDAPPGGQRDLAWSWLAKLKR